MRGIIEIPRCNLSEVAEGANAPTEAAAIDFLVS
jgi:hypothetical protein